MTAPARDAAWGGIDDRWAMVRLLQAFAVTERDEWAGVPIPVTGQRLILSPKYPHAAAFGQYVPTGDSEEDAPHLDVSSGLLEGERLRSTFDVTGKPYLVTVYVIERVDGRCYHLAHAQYRELAAFDLLLQTLGAAAGWDPHAESIAINTLAAHLSEHQATQYGLTGMFLETSKRSGVTYLFRRSRPTIATRAGRDGRIHFLAALCLHPIGYYANTYAGAMAPSDDVLAHLLLMRGDERRFWAQANQHHYRRPGSGL
ncbi:MAG TPA: hypothetical protein VFN76_09800 [Candidatus Limnocylindria bacterium]|nr:hypothetical protein [Candidatus Limnocylindria bacterium]